MRALIMTTLTSLGCFLSASDLNVEAPIAKVRVHPDEAWVSRIAHITTHSGSQRYRIADLPTGLTLEDVRVSVKGPDGTRLGNVSVSSEPRKLNQSAAWKKLEAESKLLNEENIHLLAQSMAMDESRRILIGIQATKAGEGANRPAYVPPDPNSLLNLSRSIQADCQALFERQRRLTLGIDQLGEKSARVSKAFDKLKNQDQKAPSIVTVEVESPSRGALLIEVQTRTKEARWKPSYETRLSEDRKEIELICLASVSQLTGEDWNGVTVEIANAQTTRSLDAPKPGAGVSLGYQAPLPPPSPVAASGASSRGNQYMVDGVAVAGVHDTIPPSGPLGRISGIVRDQNGTPLAGVKVSFFSQVLIAGPRFMLTDANGLFLAVLLPPGNYKLTISKEGHLSSTQNLQLGAGMNIAPQFVLRKAGETLVMVTASSTPEDEELPEPALERAAPRIEEAGGLSRTYMLEGSKDIPSDAEPHRFTVIRSKLASNLTLRSVPRISADVFLLAAVKPDPQFPWFPDAPVVVFQGGDRLGVQTLPSLTPGKPVRFSFGPLPGVQIQRQILEARTESAGAFGKDRAWILKQRFTGSNERDEILDIEIQEHGLRTNSSHLKVEYLEGGTAAYEDKNGVKSWKVRLKAHDSAFVEESIRVRAPQSGTIPELTQLGLPQSD